MPPKVRLRASYCGGTNCSHPRCGSCLAKDCSPDCGGLECSQPRCRTCEGTETDREEDNQYHRAKAYLESPTTVDLGQFSFRNPPIPAHGKVNGGQPSISRLSDQALLDSNILAQDEKRKCKVCKNWEKYWKWASTLTDEERRWQDDTKLHFLFARSGIHCICAPDIMARRIVREYHLDWEPRDKDGRAINFHAFGPKHEELTSFLEEVKAEKRSEKTEKARKARYKKHIDNQNAAMDFMIIQMRLEKELKERSHKASNIINKHGPVLGPQISRLAHGRQMNESDIMRPPLYAGTIGSSSPAGLAAGVSYSTSEFSRKRRYTETIDSEENGSLLPSVEKEDRSGLLNPFQDPLTNPKYDFLCRVSLNPGTENEARLQQMVGRLLRREAEMRRLHVRELEELSDGVDQLLQGCTCEARLRWLSDL